MFRRRKTHEESPGLQQFLQQTAHLMDPTSPEAVRSIREARTEPPADVESAEAAQQYLPPDLATVGDEEYAGRMMRHADPLLIDGVVRTCPVCGVDRDWLVICVGSDIWLRCRSAHETCEPALSGAWYEATAGPLKGVFESKDEALANKGFDGTFSGTIFTD